MFKATFCTLGLVFASSCMAHEIMIMPTKSIVTKAPATVAVDITASHGVFRADKAVSVDNIAVYGVDGKPMRHLGTIVKSATRTSFDLSIDSDGTYKIIYGSREPMFLTTYTIGKRDTRKRLRGSKIDLKDQIPAEAKNVTTTKMSRYGMSFITAKMPTDNVITPSNQGFEIIPVTHPADYVNGEEIEFQALLNGQPVAGVEATIKAEAAQYNSALQPIKLTTDKEGFAHATFDQAGRYASTFRYSTDSQDSAADKESYSVFYTFEVVYE